MKMVVERYGIKIVPENEIDEAYIEEVLGLEENQDTVPCRRNNAIGLGCISNLSITKEKKVTVG